MRNKLHYIIAKCPYFLWMPSQLRLDIERCLDSKAYNNYSMKKGSEHHLTLIIESRILKL